MGKTKRSVEVAYLDPEKLELLKRLTADTRIPRAVLMREAGAYLLPDCGNATAQVIDPLA